MKKQFYSSFLKTGLLGLILSCFSMLSFAQTTEVYTLETTANAPILFFIPSDLVANQAITLIEAPSNGTVDILDPSVFGIPPEALGIGVDLVIQYTPNQDYIGVDTFEIEVCDTIALICSNFEIEMLIDVAPPPPNNGNVFLIEDFFQVFEDETTPLDPLANDFGNNLQLTGASGGIGTVVIDGDLVNYTPDPGFVGFDSFTYTACDDQGDCATGSAHVNVIPFNNGAVDAIDDFYILPFGDTTLDVLVNDIGTGLQLTSVSGAFG
ncbi:MAG: Ig-like domain-containing protein, partial [Bacteroidota bacterium]